MFAIKNERFHIYSSTETTVTGIQNSEMRGRVYEQSIYKGTTAFSSDSQKGENYSDYKGSIVEGYVNTYKDILTSYGAQIEEARLITYKEINEIFKCSPQWACQTTYPWIYATSYWTGSQSRVTTIVWVV